MRKRLIDAAIDCLNEYGLGMTTLQRITDRAKASRGAFIHHFPTRVDLLIAVAEHAAESQNIHVRRRLAREPGLPIFEAITSATWEAIVQPTAIALLEIMIGARSDETRPAFSALIDRLQAAQREGVWEQAQLAGIKDRETIRQWFTFIPPPCAALYLSSCTPRTDRRRSEHGPSAALR